MSEIIYTPKNFMQIYRAMESYIIASNTGLSNFNIGSRIRVILEAIALVSGQTNYEFYDGLLSAIPISLYEGLQFRRKGASVSSGYISAGTKDEQAQDTLFPLISINYNNVVYRTKYQFVIKQGEKVVGKVVPFPVSSIIYESDWDASTNSPSIPEASAANKGHYYKVSVSGSTEINGENQWQVGDWLMSSGNKWYKLVDTLDIPASSTTGGANTNLSLNDIRTQDGYGSFAENYGLDFAYNTTTFSGGTDEETDEERRLRFIDYIDGLTRSTPYGIASELLKLNEVKSVYIKEYYPLRGWVTIYYDNGTATYDAEIEKKMGKVLDGDSADIFNYPGARAAGIKIQFLPPILKQIDLQMHYRINAFTQYRPQDIVDAADSAVQSYINNLKLGSDMILTEIIAAAQNAHIDIYDVSIQAIWVNGDLQPYQNVSVILNEICKNNSILSSYVLIRDE